MVPCLFALLATLTLAKIAVNRIQGLNYRLVSASVGALILLMVGVLAGIWGLAIALLSAMIGTFTGLAGVKKSHCMGVLVVPTIVYYL